MNKQVQAIRNEIDRRLKYTIERLDQSTCEKEREFDFGSRRAYIDLLSFIDSLPEEKPSEDLEEAAENYIAPIENDEGLDYINFNGRDIKDAFIAGAQWQKDTVNIDISEQIAAAFQLGGKAKEEQMMKDAVECVVYAGMEGNKWIVSYIGNYESLVKTCEVGDKVRVIVIPNTDEK